MQNTYNIHSGTNRITHVVGLFNLMDRRGPPDLNDELDVHLSFGSQGPLVRNFASRERLEYFGNTRF